MNSGKTLFAQVMEYVPWTSFTRIVARYSGDARVSVLRSAEHFRIMAYAQLTWRESLRDIEVTLSANSQRRCGRGGGQQCDEGIASIHLSLPLQNVREPLASTVSGRCMAMRPGRVK